MFKPELLSPAGDTERLQAAVMYGADAVYLGSTSLGMRAAPQNFNAEQLKNAVELCHGKGMKVYLTCNVLAHNSDLLALPSVVESAVEAGVDASFSCKREHFVCKPCLQERLAAGKGNSAILTEILTEALCFSDYFFGGVFRSDSAFPRIGIVADVATEIAARKKHHEAHSRSVKCAERLY